MTDRVECVVAGAGVVGLAIARALALQGIEVLVLEAESAFGTHTSSRNSEVIHAGIYYPADSIKARTCVAGKTLLYDYCDQHGVDYRKTGKLIVATRDDQMDTLRAYLARGRSNGVDDLDLVNRERLGQLEPEVRGVAALWSPSTGIVDSHGFMLSLLGDFENAGGALVTNSPVRSVRQIKDGFEIDVGTGDTLTKLRSNMLVNSAGHGAIELAGTCQAGPVPDNFYPAGHYFSYQGKSPFNHLVYPIADAGSLGLHGTLDLAGQLKFGPDVAWRASLDYSFDSDKSHKQHFENRIRDYYPGLDADRLQPGYVGVRPRISGPGEPARDFVISGPQSHGMNGLVQLFGIESPGLTACLAIASEVVEQLSGH